MNRFYINLGGRFYQTNARTKAAAIAKAKRFEKENYFWVKSHPKDILIECEVLPEKHISNYKQI